MDDVWSASHDGLNKAQALIVCLRAFVLCDRSAHLTVVCSGQMDSTPCRGFTDLPVIVHSRVFGHGRYNFPIYILRRQTIIIASFLYVRSRCELASIEFGERRLSTMECAKQSHFKNSIIPILRTLNRPVLFGRVYGEEVSSNALSGDAGVSHGIVVICQRRKFVSITGAKELDDRLVEVFQIIFILLNDETRQIV